MHRRLALVLLLCAAPLAGASPAVTGPVPLGNLGGSPYAVRVMGSSRSNTVVGAAEKRNQDPDLPQPFTVPIAWTAAGGLRVIADEPGVAMAANTFGHVTGAFGLGQHEAFYWKPDGTLVRFSHPDAFHIMPQAINDAGQVAGTLHAGDGPYAFLWSAATGLRNLGSLGGNQLSVTDLTENGMVVGWAEREDGAAHAFSWKNNGPMRDLGTLGGMNSYAEGAAEDGTVVGFSQLADGFTNRAFRHKNNQMTALASPAGESYATAINGAGLIVGSAGGAIVWHPNGTYQLIEGADRAVAVNESGVVAVNSGTGTSQTPRAKLWSAAAGLRSPDGDEHDQRSEAFGVTAGGSLVARRLDWSGVDKSFVWTPGSPRTLIDGLAGSWSRALLVNAAGRIAGISRTPLGYNRAFLWTPSASGGSMSEIPAPAGRHSTPVALNESGAVVGSTQTPLSGFLTIGPSWYWPGSGSGFTDLGQVTVVDLNDVGQVLAYAYPTSAFVWKNGTTTLIPPIGEGPAVPADLNNNGQVVGRYNVDAWTIHAFSWKAGSAPVDLGTLGGTYAEAVAVNESGQIAGSSDRLDGTTHAFRTTAGKRMTDLGALFAGGHSTAVAMNKNGHVVGLSNDFDAVHAFLYDTRLRDLGNRESLDSGELALNDLKDVVGWRLGGEFFEPRAFYGLGGAPIQDLPGLGGGESRAFRVNAAGVAVGDAVDLDGLQQAVLWRLR